MQIATLLAGVAVVAGISCDLSGQWSGSYNRPNPPRTAGAFHIQHLAGQTSFTVDTTTEFWQHADGNLTNTRVVAVHFSHGSGDKGDRLNGVLTDCNRIDWQNSTVWCRGSPGNVNCGRDPTAKIKKAHVVWMNHLDLGFTGMISSVVNTYFHEYFPLAVDTASKVNIQGQPPKFKYTAHSWLLDLFFDCPARVGLNCSSEVLEPRPRRLHDGGGNPTPPFHPNCILCPNATEVAAVEKAIHDGAITWHAFPHNGEPEAASADLFSDGVELVHSLDRRFGQANKTVMSLRDVPGASRAMLPLLNAKGVRGFSLGANSQLQSPELPSIFNWTDLASGASVVALVHQNGYGLDSRKQQLGVSRPDPCPALDGFLHRADFVTVDGFPEALVYAFKDDNRGPHTVADTNLTLGCVEALFPDAEIIGSTFDAFLARLLEHGTESLPVVTSEVGDIWIYGLQADNMKTKQTRLMMRARAACKDCSFEDPAFRNFTRLLLKNNEHTWGLHGLGHHKASWTNKNLRAMLAADTAEGELFRRQANSWVEQRLFSGYALEALQQPEASRVSSALAATISANLAAAAPEVPPTVSGYERLALKVPISLLTANFGLQVNTQSGDIESFTTPDGHEWVRSDASGALFGFTYQSNSDSDFQTFHTEVHPSQSGMGSCYLKNGMKEETCGSQMGCAVHKNWKPRLLEAFWCGEDRKEACGASNKQWLELRSVDVLQTASRLLLHLSMPEEPHAVYGSPSELWVEYLFPRDAAEVLVDLQWVNKTSTRLPESLFFSFAHAAPKGADAWHLSKLGQTVAATDVVSGGSVRLHAVDVDGATRRHEGGRVKAQSVDSALISIDQLSAFPTPLYTLSSEQAAGDIHFPLQNNYWDVNYPYWYPFARWTKADADARFRFMFTFESSQGTSAVV